jgi:Glycosyl transferase family 2
VTGQNTQIPTQETRMPRPEVTVIVPTRERPHYLRTTLLSILASAAEAECTMDGGTRILVVDDASETDSTRRVAESLGVDYVRIAEHDGRFQPGSAIRLGVSKVDTPYYTIFGDDDIMLPRHLPLHLRNLRDGIDVSSASFHITDSSLTLVRTVLLRQPHLGDLLAGKIRINDGSVTRTEIVSDLDFDPSLDAQILYPIWATLLIRGHSFKAEPEPTFLYRRHDANISDRGGPADQEIRDEIQAKMRALAKQVLGSVPEPAEPADRSAAIVYPTPSAEEIASVWPAGKPAAPRARPGGRGAGAGGRGAGGAGTGGAGTGGTGTGGTGTGGTGTGGAGTGGGRGLPAKPATRPSRPLWRRMASRVKRAALVLIRGR